MRFCGIFLLFFCVKATFAQQITVVDAQNEQPLFNVAIFNSEKSKSVVTNFDGKADISAFNENEKLFFSHVSYLQTSFLKSEIKNKNYKIQLQHNPNVLGEIILSVSKFEQNQKKIPQQVIQISKEEIKLFNPQTSADLLESSGKIYVQKSQMGGGSPMIRGFSTNRLLITMDGVRMNNAIFRGGNIQNVISIDPLALQRTEVVLGAGPVVYGSDAVGGVMNFYTLEPEFSVENKTSFTGSAFTRYATANNEKTAHVDFNFQKQKWSFLSSATVSDFEDLRMGSHGPDEYLRPFYVARINDNDVVVENENPQVQVPTGYEQLNLLQKVRFKPNEEWDFNLSGYYSTTSNFPRYDRLYQIRNGQYRFAEWFYGPQEWFFSNFQIQKTGKGKLYDNLKFNAAYQFFEESRNNRAFGEDILYENIENVDAYSGNLDLEKRFSKSKLFYGAEYLYNKVSSEGKSENITTGATEAIPARYPDGSTLQTLAAYASNQWEINPKLSLQTGARYSHILIDADFDNWFFNFPFEEVKISTGALTGNIGLSWQQTDFLNWKINLASAFRAPNIDDVGKVFDSEPGAVVVPNPNLKPEHAYNAEIAMALNLDEKFSINLATFYTYLEDAMIRRDFELNGASEIIYQGEISRVQAIQNAAKAYVYGFEAGARFFISENLNFSSQLTIVKGMEEQEDGTTAALRHAAPLFGNSHLVWQKQKLKLDFFAEYNGEFENHQLAPSEQAKAYLYAIDENGNPYAPSWYTLNFAAKYDVSQNWLISASLENITDQRYRTYSSGISAAGRNFILALGYSF